MQRWTADLSNDGGRLRKANASVSGYGLGGPADFQATRAAPTAVSKPAPDPVGSPQSTLVGQWRWTCCRNTHAGTFSIKEQTAEGHFHGIFGASPFDGSTPFAGTYRNGAIVFTRFLLVGGASQNQQWRARIGTAAVPEMLDGRWSGYAAGGGNEDFHATKVQGR